MPAAARGCISPTMPQRTVGGVVVKFESHYRYASRKTGISQGECQRAVEAVFRSVIKQTKEIGSSKLAGLFHFKFKTAGAVPKYWKNLRTGIYEKLPDKPRRKTAFVKPTKKLKKLMNESRLYQPGGVHCQRLHQLQTRWECNLLQIEHANRLHQPDPAEAKSDCIEHISFRPKKIIVVVVIITVAIAIVIGIMVIVFSIIIIINIIAHLFLV